MIISTQFVLSIIQFLVGKINHTPDVYLEELREALEEESGVKVTISSIWKALKRKGYTMKKVSKEVFGNAQS